MGAFDLDERQVAGDCDLSCDATGAQLHVEDNALADGQPNGVIESLTKPARLNFDFVGAGRQECDWKSAFRIGGGGSFEAFVDTRRRDHGAGYECALLIGHGAFESWAGHVDLSWHRARAE